MSTTTQQHVGIHPPSGFPARPPTLVRTTSSISRAIEGWDRHCGRIFHFIRVCVDQHTISKGQRKGERQAGCWRVDCPRRSSVHFRQVSPLPFLLLLPESRWRAEPLAYLSPLFQLSQNTSVANLVEPRSDQQIDQGRLLPRLFRLCPCVNTSGPLGPLNRWRIPFVARVPALVHPVRTASSAQRSPR